MAMIIITLTKCFQSFCIFQHRVATIIDSDKILVLSDGHMAEYDTPERLLAQENSIFSALVKGGK